MSAIIFDAAGAVLLQRRDDNRRWGLPGGAVDPGETVHAAIRREVREETGLEIDPIRLIGVYSDPAGHQVMAYPDGNVTHFVSIAFECVVTGGVLTLSAESLELGWFDPRALPDDTMAVSRIRLADALARQTAAFVR